MAKKKQFRILSIDGGGVRGLIPAVVLSHIEHETGKPIADMFDLIAGTSTGGILALGLAKPDSTGRPEYTADDLVELYRKEGGNIFSRSVWHRVRALGYTIEEKYPSEGIENTLKAYFRTSRLKSALTNVIVPAYEIELRQPWFFKSHKALKKPEERDYPMWYVARATSAAPTYFEPFRIPPPRANEKEPPADYYSLVDGGVYANNPAMCAYAEARAEWPEYDDILIVSLGTGELTRRLPRDEVAGWGLANWAQPILSVVFDGVSDTVDYHLSNILRTRDDGPRYFRFQLRLDEGNDDMDDASNTNLRVLKLRADQLVASRSKDLDQVCAALAD